jgi:hypothetical protein
MSSYTFQLVNPTRPKQEQQEVVEEEYDSEDPRLYCAGSHTPVLFGDHRPQTNQN